MTQKGLVLEIFYPPIFQWLFYSSQFSSTLERLWVCCMLLTVGHYVVNLIKYLGVNWIYPISLKITWHTMTWVTLDHLVGWLKAGICDFTDWELFMVSLLCRDNRSIRSQREVNSGIWHQVGLELSEIHIEGAIKPEWSCDGAHYLTNQSEIEIRPGLKKLSQCVTWR